MRVFFDNIFLAHSDNIDYSNLLYNNSINYYTTNIQLNNISETINYFAIGYTNASFVLFSILTKDGQERYYIVSILKSIECINIEETEIASIRVDFYKNAKIENEYIICHYIATGKAVDFPPHSKNKNHTQNFTHSQFFSQSGNYFNRMLPLKKYNTWTVSFEYLTNEQKNIIEDFIDSHNFEPFILQVWKERDVGYSQINHINPDIIENAEIIGDVEKPYTFAFTENGFLYSTNPKLYKNSRVSISTQKIKYEMKMGFYVITNEKIEFSKGNNNIYQWSTSLTMREVF